MLPGMRAICVALLIACSSEEVGKRADPAVVDPADYTLTLESMRTAIEAHRGPGCLRMFTYVACRGCAPMYRLDPIEVGTGVGPCARSTFTAGALVQTKNAPPGDSFTWTCRGGALGGAWDNTVDERTGALLCRD
jgi:hypothetical protein